MYFLPICYLFFSGSRGTSIKNLTNLLLVLRQVLQVLLLALFNTELNSVSELYSLTPGFLSIDKTTSGVSSNTNPPAKVVYPDTSKMTVYDPRQIPGRSF